jgi:Bacterial TSP3 repeat
VADRLRRIGGRLADLVTDLVDAFVRDNRVLPPVLAVLALFIIAWILAGALMGGTDQKPVAHRANLAQSDKAGPGGNPVSPGVENRDVNSYAAYRSKDPFRELLAPEETTTDQPATTPEETTTPRNPGGPGATGRDTDADGIPDRRERKIGSDPNNPDTDGDGTPDGSDNDTNAGGRPGAGGAGSGTTPGTGPAGPGTDRPPSNRRDDLLNSGGILPLP